MYGSLLLWGSSQLTNLWLRGSSTQFTVKLFQLNASKRFVDQTTTFTFLHRHFN